MRRLAIILVLLICAAGVAWYVAPPKKPRGFSGLEFSVMTPSAAARAPLLTTRGALIYSVVPDSPADKAGIKPGEVAAAIDGVAINSAGDASGIMRAHRGGDRVVLTLFDETLGDIHPHQMALTVAEAPPVTKDLSVKPPRTLAKEFFYPPPMAANAAWSPRMALGPTIRPHQIFGLGAGRCNGFAPEEWVIKGHAKDDTMIHVAAKTGFQHAIYATALLKGQSPMAFIRALLQQNFQGPLTVTPSAAVPGFTMFDFGNRSGAAGFVEYRVDQDRIAVWVAAFPSADAAWNKALAGAVAFSLNCQSQLSPEPYALGRPPAATAVSARCHEGQCEDSDAAATYLKVLQLGYVHNAKGEMFLVNPKRDFWQNGAEGPGFYRQIGGENEKLEPGRTN
jgi:hypothetical protein